MIVAIVRFPLELYNEDWFERLAQKYGAKPIVEYFESPVTVDPDHITVE